MMIKANSPQSILLLFMLPSPLFLAVKRRCKQATLLKTTSPSKWRPGRTQFQYSRTGPLLSASRSKPPKEGGIEIRHAPAGGRIIKICPSGGPGFGSAASPPKRGCAKSGAQTAKKRDPKLSAPPDVIPKTDGPHNYLKKLAYGKHKNIRVPFVAIDTKRRWIGEAYNRDAFLIIDVYK
jgi:hypothetical protein